MYNIYLIHENTVRFCLKSSLKFKTGKTVEVFADLWLVLHVFIHLFASSRSSIFYLPQVLNLTASILSSWRPFNISCLKSKPFHLNLSSFLLSSLLGKINLFSKKTLSPGTLSQYHLNCHCKYQYMCCRKVHCHCKYHLILITL